MLKMIRPMMIASLIFGSCRLLADQSLNMSPADGVFMGDLFVGADQIEEIAVPSNGGLFNFFSNTLDLSQMNQGILQPQAAIKSKVQLWTDGVLPIVFADNVTDERRQKFLAACQEWSIKTGVRCALGPYKNNSLQVGKWTSGCWSTWGMNQGTFGYRRKINLDEACWQKQTLMHEIGHNLGLIHEHQRPDRDQYINVFHENVDGVFMGANCIINFGKQKESTHTDYDFLSIMHYDRKAFSKNGKDTILPLAQYSKYNDVIGAVNVLSEKDIQQVKTSYFGSPEPE